MPPTQLLTQRLRETLAARGQGHGAVAVRATLTQDGRVVGQRSFAANAPAPSGDAPGDAPGGARALAAASDDVIAQLSAWLAAAR